MSHAEAIWWEAPKKLSEGKELTHLELSFIFPSIAGPVHKIAQLEGLQPFVTVKL